MQPKYFTIAVKEQHGLWTVLFDGQITYNDAIDRAHAIATTNKDRICVFLGGDCLGKLVWDSAEWRGVTC